MVSEKVSAPVFFGRDVFSDQPVSLACFAQCMAQLGPFFPDQSDYPPIAMAVSGGGDSLCLAWLASFWRKNLLALVVDHGLRPESGQEAQQTIARLQAMNIPAQLLVLTDLKKGSAMAHRAREARYARLIAACQEYGCTDLLLGHQADDLAETVWMRQNSSSGPEGLAGMGWITVRPDIRLIRPLLGFSRLALRNTLRQACVEWVDDPSNQDQRAERVRLRFLLQENDQRAHFWKLGMQSGQLRMCKERERAAQLAQHAVMCPEGWAMLGSELPDVDVLAALIRSVGGAEYPPAQSAVVRLKDMATEATLAGTRFIYHKQQWMLMREEAAMAPAQQAENGTVWDNRFVLYLPVSVQKEGLMIAGAGYGLARKIRNGQQAKFCAVLPALWRAGKRVAVPHLGWVAENEPDLHGAEFIFRPTVSVSSSNVYGAIAQDS
ncbi:tRNA lysidine(34) synthetase TilS [Acetobacter ascendens]|uniref:tRNA lysidine(34) synthetase TilS n=1 Tax=Acetobacter ascendens TaxID=481146 RepID=UPI000875EB5B|nr:tRNA lysidine(34) synthetase TilS [Acetobacter ascendens]AOW48741.1 tRNA lysidine(34) synthetase TilS [Acetobacter ascendens]